MELQSTDSDNENDTDSSYSLYSFILAVKMIVMFQIFTTEAAPCKYYFLDSFKKFCKIPKKTFRKRSMFVTASDFWFTTLPKMNN